MKFKKLSTLLLISSISFLTSFATAADEKELTFYIMRHGKTMLNTTDRVQGWSDAVLTPVGKEVVVNAAKGLKDIKFQAIYSSDSGRAMETAQIVKDYNNDAKNLVIQPDARFREFNFGTYEGDLNPTMWMDIAKFEGFETLEDWMKTMTPSSFANSVAKLDAARVKEQKIKYSKGDWIVESINDLTYVEKGQAMK
jgi:probable phosphoglycerate mutase